MNVLSGGPKDMLGMSDLVYESVTIRSPEQVPLVVQWPPTNFYKVCPEKRSRLPQRMPFDLCRLTG